MRLLLKSTSVDLNVFIGFGITGKSMDMQALVNDWKANAQKYDDRNFAFLHSLKMKSDKAGDQAVHQLHEEAVSIIDCSKCTNCCTTISPQFQTIRSD
jgi:hypothetical protein